MTVSGMAEESDLVRIVDDKDVGERLDVLVARVTQVGSRAHAAALIDQGGVTVDGVARPKSYRPPTGATVRIALEDEAPATLTAEDLPVPLAYEDAWLMVADKPPGMVVHPAKGHGGGTLVNALLGRGIAGGEAFRPGLVHRLDRDTSGLLVVAKDDAVQRALSAMIREHRIDRRYLALVHGNLPTDTGTIDAPIGRDLQRRKTMTVGGAANGRRSPTSRSSSGWETSPWSR